MRLRWFAIGAVVLLAAGGFYFLRRPREKPPEYRTARVERGTITSTITATGTLKPVTMVQVGSQVSGTILTLHADFNSNVKRGQVVAQLDPSFLRSQLAQAEASLTRAEVTVTDSERTFRRSQELLARGLLSQAEVDAAEATMDRSRAELKQARASVEQARVNLDHTTISSPIDGVVVSRNVNVGQTVAASLQAPILFEIANDLTAMQVEASVDEADIGQVRIGQAAHFTVDAFPDAPFDGVVSQIRLQPITVQNVVTYTTVIAVANPELKLRPGMTANVTVDVARRDDVLRIPAAALSFKPAVPSGPGGKSGGMDGRPAGGVAAAAGRRAGGEGAGRPGAPGGARAGGAGAHRAGPPGGQMVYLRSNVSPPRGVSVRTGITDGYFTELTEGDLKEGDEVIVGLAGASAGNGGPTGGPRNPLAQRRGPF